MSLHCHDLITDNMRFFAKFLKSPRTVGSIYPSSKYLTRKILNPIPWKDINSIVELGAGTGAFTAEINKFIQTDCQGFIFELDDDLRRSLRKKYPDLEACKDAKQLSKILANHGLGKTDCIISGLPFAAFSEEDRSDIINEVVNSLNDGGVFLAFQYSLQLKSLLKEKFSRVEIKFVTLNLPPAFVYLCYK